MSTEKASKCPVCDWEMKDGGTTAKVDGKDVVVCCDECAETLKENSSKGKPSAK